MKSRILSFSIVVWLAAGAALRAAPIVVAKAPGQGKEGITVTGLAASGEGGALFLATLKNDLQRAGWYRLEAGAFAGIRVTGSASGAGEGVRTSLEVAWSAGRFAWGESAQGKAEIRRQAHRLCDAITQRVLNKKGMAATRIVFVGKHDGSDLYVCDADGLGLARLTQDRVNCLAPTWDPASRYIYYTTYIKGFPCIYRVPAGGGGRQPLAKFTGLNTGGAVAPDGGLMALVLSISGNPELYVLNMASRNVTRLTQTPMAAEASPCWSPDGNSIAYVSDGSRKPQLHVIRQSDKQPRRLTFKGSENVAPDWGPDGRIAYCTRQSGYQIAIIDPATGAAEIISSGPDHEDPSWAPDGRHIVCSRAEGRKRATLYILDTMGDPPLRLLTIEGQWVSPDWSER